MKQIKKIIMISGGIILFLGMVWGYIYFNLRGTYLWGNLVFHDTLHVISFQEGGPYNDHYEKKVNPELCYLSEPNYTEEELFGKDCKFIFLGKVLKIEDFLFEEGKHTYSCHTITVQIEKNIFGRLKKNQKVQILRKWNSISEKDIVDGREGIFIVRDRPTKIIVSEKNKFMSIGNMHQDAYHGYCMVEEMPEVKKLNTKKEVVDFWKEQNWLKEK